MSTFVVEDQDLKENTNLNSLVFFCDPKRSHYHYDPQRSQRENQTAAGNPAGNISHWWDISKLQVLPGLPEHSESGFGVF